MKTSEQELSGMRLYDKLAVSHPKLSRGQVWCVRCGKTRRVDPSLCFRLSWPECCGETMTIDSPDERRQENRK